MVDNIDFLLQPGVNVVRFIIKMVPKKKKKKSNRTQLRLIQSPN